jgi:hypothetical protein
MALNFADLNVKECRLGIHVWPKTDQVIGRACQDCGGFAEGGNLALARNRSSPFSKNAIAIGIFVFLSGRQFSCRSDKCLSELWRYEYLGRPKRARTTAGFARNRSAPRRLDQTYTAFHQDRKIAMP